MEPLAVPYVSQWDETAHFSRGDCGIVAACMVALWRGIQTTPDGMLKNAGLPVGKLTYTFNEVIAAAKHVGLTLIHRPSAHWADIRAELDAGRPVISLLRYGEISGNQDDFDGAHFWVCVGYDAKHVIVNDPDWREPRRAEGHNRRVPITELARGIGFLLHETGNQAYQSLFFVP